MTAIKPGDVERAVRVRGPDIIGLLFYGPDAGLAAERARNAAEAAVADPGDPFQLVRIDGDAVADAPGRLVEEASTYGLLGGSRGIWVRPTSRNISGAVAACLDMAPAATLLVIEAGDLARSSPLRSLCERSPRALALPCYPDEARDIGAMVAEALRAEGLEIDRDARDLLLDCLGGDRLTTRGELAKLTLYGHGRRTISLADVEAVVGDVSGLSFDAAIDAAFAGDAATLDANLAQLAHRGTAPAAILATTLRHSLFLVEGRMSLDEGRDLDSALKAWRGLHFRRRDAVGRQLLRWTAIRLARAIELLQEAVLETRRSPALAPAILARTLFRLSDAGMSTASGRPEAAAQ